MDALVARVTAAVLATIGTGGAPLLGAGSPTGSVERGSGEGELVLRSNLGGEKRQSGQTNMGVGRIDMNGWDFGLRLVQNRKHEGTGKVGYLLFGGNGRGAFEVNYFPPVENVDDTPGRDFGTAANFEDPTHPLYRWYRGQGFVVDQGSQPVTEYNTGRVLSHRRHLMIGTQREQWGIFEVVSPVRPSADGSGRVETGLPINYAVRAVDGDGRANPHSLVIGGRLQRLVPITLPDGREVVGMEEYER